MKKYTELVIKVDVKDKKDLIAGYDMKYCKAMILTDKGLDDHSIFKSGQDISCVYPTSSTEKEQAEILKIATARGFHVVQAVIGSLGIAEFYKSQAVLQPEDTFVITIETDRIYTDLTLLKQSNGSWHIQKKERMDVGGECGSAGAAMNESALIYRTAAGIHRLKQAAGIRSVPKILLAGQFWNLQVHVENIKNKLPENRIFAYKPTHIIALGALEFLKRHSRRHPACNVPDHFASYQCTRFPASEFEKLTPKRQEMYQKKLDAIVHKKPEIIYAEHVDSDDIKTVQEALFIDHPEIDFLIDYMEGKVWTTKINGKKCVVKENLIYTDQTLLKKIDQKIEEIIKKSLKGESLTDAQIVRAIYEHMTKAYHYTTEPVGKDGKFPAYCYTLEALLSAGVCSSYSRSLVYILGVKLQIPCRYVVGEVLQRISGAGDHAWAIIQTPDKGYRQYDLTFDLGKETKGYFAMDDLAARSRGHFLDGKSKYQYPACK